MSDKMMDLQWSIRDYLRSFNYFSDALSTPRIPITVLTEAVADLETEVDEALSNASGLCVLIRTPGGEIPSADHGGPVYDPARIHIRIYENPYLNRMAGGTRQPSGAVADAIIRLLWTFHQTVTGYNAPIVPTSRAWGLEQHTGLPFYDVLLKTVVALDTAEPSRADVLTDEHGATIGNTGAGSGDIIP